MEKQMVKVDLEQKTVNVLKALIMDTVRNADSGHTGGPFSSLDFTYVLYKDFLKYNPDDPLWFDRDRFVLSAGHESALLYTMFTLIGWLEVNDLKKFRRLGSRTPGHPERGVTPGVEATTGPLGQGFGNAVGMAVSEVILREKFGSDIVNHYTYVLHSDGDIQEPVAQGSAAIAGHWGLGKLIAYYDANKAQISGPVSRSDSTDYAQFYSSNNWHVQEINGQDRDAIRDAIRRAQMEIDRPSVIIGHNVIAPGCATMEGDHNTHGAPLPPEEIAATKEKMGLAPNSFFDIPNDIVSDFRESYEYARSEVRSWDANLNKRLNSDKSFKLQWNLSQSGDMSDVKFPVFNYGETMATRKVWGEVLSSITKKFDFLVGGSADLEPSNVTTEFAKEVGDFHAQNHPSGRNFAYGVREFPMGALNNGIAQHGGLKVFGATFFVFSDYERPALRMRAIQSLPVVSEYTHDSIYVGEDGPTHQPIEHIMSCRAIPNLLVLRPADANEAVEASKIAFGSNNRPSIVLLTRQGLPVLDRNRYAHFSNFSKGGYIISDCDDVPDVTILSSGSEVWVSLEVQDMLKNFRVRVVNMGSWELFDEQSCEYRESVIDRNSLLVSVEAGITMGWQKYTGLDGINIGIDCFGESAPGKEVANHFGITSNNITNIILSRLSLDK